MNLNAWKLVGVICSGIWLLVSGSVTALISLIGLACLFEPKPRNPNPEYWSFKVFGYVLLKDIRPWMAPGYILFGAGPVIGFAILMSKLGHPLGSVQLIGLGICAIIPFVWFLLAAYWP
jgi:hypothetical protein